MNNNELKRLNRIELLELLLAERKRNDALEKELLQLKGRLDDRELRVGRAGTLAEAAINVNAVLEAADAAAEQYLENLRRRSEEADRAAEDLLEQTRRRCERMIQQAELKADVILVDARLKAGKRSTRAEPTRCETDTKL